MALITKGILAPVLVDEPIVDFDVVFTTILPAPIIAVTSVTPSLIPVGTTTGVGSAAIATPGPPGVAVTINYTGAWPQENFPGYLYQYIILPDTITTYTATDIEAVPAGATIFSYTADLTPAKVNVWTITVSDGTVLTDTQIVYNNWQRQQIKLKARLI